MSTRLRRITAPAALAGLLAIPVTAAGQTSQPQRDRQQDETQADDGGGILAGPKVDQESLQENAGYGGGRGRNTRAVPIAPRVWYRLVGRLELNAQQREAVGEIQERFAGEQREFQQEYGARLRELQRIIRETQATDRAVDRELVVEAREIRTKAPSVNRAQSEVWELLDDDQQDRLRDLLTEMRNRQAEQRRQRRQRDGAAGDDAMGMAPPTTPDDNGMTEEERVRARTGGMYGGGLDERALRRLRFLRKHQSTRLREIDQPRDARPQRDRDRDRD